MTSFFNGGGNLLTGVLFNTGEELLTLFSQALEQENWEIVADNITTSQNVLLKGITTNAHNCHIKASYAGNQFQIQGDLDGTNTELSPILNLEFNSGESNRFWLTCDNESGAIAIKRKYFYSGGINFGFLDRFDPSDAFAWMVAKFNNKLTDAYVAKSKHDDTIWHCIGDAFADADIITSTFMNGAFQGILDLQVVVNAYISFVNTNLRNAGYRADLGQITIDDLIIFSQRFYIEGRGEIDNYATADEEPPLLYNRGFVKFVQNGGGKLASGRTELNEYDDRYLSVGDETEGWQLLQITSGTQVLEDLPVIFRPEAGIAYLNSTNLLDEVRNTLTNIGWETTRANDTRIIMRSQFFDTQNFCFIRVEVENGVITLQGDETGEENNLSPAITFSYTSDLLNRVWQTVNKQSGAISFLDAGNDNQGGAWFGFFKINQPLWGIGQINSDARKSYILEEGIWKSLGADYTYNYDTFSSFPITTHDFLTTAGLPILFFNNQDDRNSAKFAYKGQINGADNKARLNYFGFMNGLGGALAYGISDQGDGNAPKYNRLLIVNFVANGAASLDAGEIIIQSGATYKSVGGSTWQAMRLS